MVVQGGIKRTSPAKLRICVLIGQPAIEKVSMYLSVRSQVRIPKGVTVSRVPKMHKKVRGPGGNSLPDPIGRKRTNLCNRSISASRRRTQARSKGKRNAPRATRNRSRVERWIRWFVLRHTIECNVEIIARVRF